MTAPHPAPTSAPLPLEHARAARRAGALGGALVGVGLPLALSPAFAWGFSAIYAGITNLAILDPDGEMEPEVLAVFERMLALLATPPALTLAAACVLVGGALVAAGIGSTIRRLRRAGVHRPVGVALLGLLLARAGTLLVGVVLGGLPDVLVASWLTPLLSAAMSDVLGATSESLAVLVSAVVVLVGIVVAAGSWLGVGILTTWWMAWALRAKAPAAPTQQWQADAWSAPGVPVPSWRGAAPASSLGDERPLS